MTRRIVGAETGEGLFGRAGLAAGPSPFAAERIVASHRVLSVLPAAYVYL